MLAPQEIKPVVSMSADNETERQTDPSNLQLVLHVGPPKTGTTSLQTMLQRLYGAPTTRRIWYPTPAAMGPGHALLAELAVGFNNEIPNPQVINHLLSQARSGDCKTLIISSENFSEIGTSAGLALRAVLEECESHLVFTLSPIARRLLSVWQEFVKHGVTTRLAESCDMIINQPGMRSDFVERLISLLNPSRATVIVTNTENSAAKIAQDFCSAIGLDPAQVPNEEGVRLNKSLGAIELELLLQANQVLESRGLTFPFASILNRSVFETEKWRNMVPFEPVRLPVELAERCRDLAGDTIAALAKLTEDKKVALVGDIGHLKDDRTISISNSD